MCGFSSIEDGLIYRAFVPPSEALVERTRAIEAVMQGERVPEDAWLAFFSPACSAIEWPHFERMFRARKSAVAFLAIEVSTRRRARARSAFRCVAD